MTAMLAERPRKQVSADDEEEPATRRRPRELHAVSGKSTGGVEDPSEDRISGTWKKVTSEAEEKRLAEAAETDKTVRQLREQIRQIPRNKLDRHTIETMQLQARKAALVAEQRVAQERAEEVAAERERVREEVTEESREVKDLKRRVAMVERELKKAKEEVRERELRNAQVQEMLDTGEFQSGRRHKTMRGMTEKYADVVAIVKEKEDVLRTAKRELVIAESVHRERDHVLAELDELEAIVTAKAEERQQELEELPDVPEPPEAAPEPDLDSPVYDLNSKGDRKFLLADMAVATGIAGLAAHNRIKADTEPKPDHVASMEEGPDGRKKAETAIVKTEEKKEATPHFKTAAFALAVGAIPGFFTRLWKSFVKFDTAFQKDPIAAIAGLFFAPDDKK